MTNDDMLQKIKYYMVQYLIPPSIAHPCSVFIRPRLPLLQQYVQPHEVYRFVFPHLYFVVLWLFPQGHSNVKLQLAATFCISNLIWNEEDGKRQTTQVEGRTCYRTGPGSERGGRGL